MLTKNIITKTAYSRRVKPVVIHLMKTETFTGNPRYSIPPYSRRGAVIRRPARDETLSLVELVPLSHFMALDLESLNRAFVNPDGALPLAGGRYRTS